MKKFLLLLTVLLITSCSRIVMTDYELIDSGVIEKYTAPSFRKAKK